MEKTIVSLYASLGLELTFLVETSWGYNRPLETSARGSAAVRKTSWMSGGGSREPGLCPLSPCNGAPRLESKLSSSVTWTAAGSSIKVKHNKVLVMHSQEHGHQLMAEAGMLWHTGGGSPSHGPAQHSLAIGCCSCENFTALSGPIRVTPLLTHSSVLLSDPSPDSRCLTKLSKKQTCKIQTAASCLLSILMQHPKGRA